MLMAEAQKTAAGNAPPPALSPLEAEVIGLFVQLSRALGQPRSLAELYGMLFISARPLAMDDLMERLGLSKGSASQGLRFLRNAGAIKMVYIAGDRRVHYEAVAELRNLATRFLRDQIIPQLDTGLKRIEDIAGMLKQMPADKRAQLSDRVTMLRSWGKKSRKVLPIIVKLMGG
jgi:DNA-binding transcriptional regulator GbsR (MarR family)